MKYQELVNEIWEKESFLCIGLDSDITKIPAHLLKYKYSSTPYQEDMAQYVKETIKNKNIKLRDIAIINFIRGLLMERESFKLIENTKKYDCIVYVHPDMMIAKKISIKEVYQAINNKNNLYTTNFNDWNGYGTGFYIGSMEAMKNITMQISNIEKNIGKIEPEKLLKTTLLKNNVKRCKSNMFHFKLNVHGNPNVYYQLLKKYTTSDEYKNAILLYKGKQNSKKIQDDLVLQKIKSRGRRNHKRRSCPN